MSHSPRATTPAPAVCPGAPPRAPPPTNCMVDTAEALLAAGADTDMVSFTVFPVHPAALAKSSSPRFPTQRVHVATAEPGALFVIDSQLRVFKLEGSTVTHAFPNLCSAQMWFHDESAARFLASDPKNAARLAAHQPRALFV